MSKNTEELREKLAAIEHERWADWQKWCHKVLRENNPSPEIGDVLERWDRQIETPYAELSDSEKASDMEQVDRYWPLIDQYVSQKVIDADEKAHAIGFKNGKWAMTKRVSDLWILLLIDDIGIEKAFAYRDAISAQLTRKER